MPSSLTGKIEIDGGFSHRRERERISMQRYLVKAVVTSGKKAGVYLGRVACRRTGSFKIVTASGKVDGIHHRFCKLICRQDGYTYAA